MSSPWSKIERVEPANLQDIMSEEFARDLQTKEDNKYQAYLEAVEEAAVAEVSVAEDGGLCQSDAAIALMLQKQFDKEYDEILKRTEDKFNGASKVSVSYCNYRRGNDEAADSESEDELVDIIDRRDWDRFDPVQRKISGMARCGYMKERDGNMVTKHDMTISGRKNACRFMSFPPEFQTGDGAGFDLKLSNQVFNSLKRHSSKEQARRHKLHDKKEDHATAELGVDEFTRLLLYKLINKQLLERVDGVISTGKEAVILHADCDPAYPGCALPRECALKVFKTTLSEFKQRDKYIKDDYRFRDRYSKSNSRKMVQLWAEKEMHNLVRLQKAAVPCPDVIALKKHVLVMSFIGADHRPAPKLKDVQLSDADWCLAYEQVVHAMKTLYNDARLIHADLSEYNILWHADKCWFIDVSQAVEPKHPNSHHFLFRDCRNVSAFFTKRGVLDVKDPEELFMEVTGYDYSAWVSQPDSENQTKAKPQPEPEDENSDIETLFAQSATLAPSLLPDTEALQLVEPPPA